MKKLLFSLFLLGSLTLFAQQKAESPRILFIGNSYTEVNNLPSMIQQAAQSAGRDIQYDANTPGGCTFSQHCTNNSMTLIRQGGWDYVVLQEQSQFPAFPDGQVARECLPYAAQLAQAVYANNPDGEAMFYMTWGRENGDSQNGAIFPPIGTYEGMDSLLYLRYMQMKNDNDASVCPVGRVWHYIRHNYPEIQLYAGDGSHPSVAGSYAATCAFYTMFFKETPQVITWNSSLDERTAQTIRSVANTVVYDSLWFWSRGTHSDTTHHDTIPNIDTVPPVDTTTASINSINHQVLSTYPNPATSEVIIETALPMEQAELYSADGRIVRSYTKLGKSGRLDIANLPKGMYCLRVTTKEGVLVRKIVKR